MILLHWQRRQCHLYGCVTQHLVIERPSLSWSGGWASQNGFDQCELANNVPLMLFWLSREATASPSSTDDACLCTCVRERSVICQLQSTGVQKRKCHNYDPAIPSCAQHRSQQAFLIKWIISDTLRSFMGSDKIYTGVVIEAKMYWHWQVNLLWYLRCCLVSNGPHDEYISRDWCCCLPTCAFWNMPLIEEFEWCDKWLWYFVISTVTNIEKCFNCSSFSQ